MSTADPIRVGILTCSDRCAGGVREDIAGAFLKAEVVRAGWEVAEYAVVPDEVARIAGCLRNWCDKKKLNLILTCGGTGFGPRDVTPEATRTVLDRQAPGLATALIVNGLRSTPMAALSRGVAGLCNGIILVNLPGSPAAVRQGMKFLLRVLPHTLDLTRGLTSGHPAAG